MFWHLALCQHQCFMLDTLHAQCVLLRMFLDNDVHPGEPMSPLGKGEGGRKRGERANNGNINDVSY